MSLFYNDLKLFQINLTECSLGYSGIRILTVCLLIIGCKMLHTCSDMLRLDASYHSCPCLSCKVRIFRIILKITSTQWVSLNIHSRSKPQMYMEQLHLFSDDLSHSLDQIHIPRLCQCCRDRDCSTVLIISLARKFCRTIVEKSAFQTEFKRH